MSHWQSVKIRHKEGKKKKQIETHFGIKSKEFEKKFSIEKKPTLEESKPVRKSKKKSK